MRNIQTIIQSHIAPVGTFTVRRALPDGKRQSVGPWVFLDHFGPFRVTPGVDGVGAHPHAGIETVTYLLSGRNEHLDSAGHRGGTGRVERDTELPAARHPTQLHRREPAHHREDEQEEEAERKRQDPGAATVHVQPFPVILTHQPVDPTHSTVAGPSNAPSTAGVIEPRP